MRIEIPSEYVQSITSGERRVIFLTDLQPYSLGPHTLWAEDSDGLTWEVPVNVTALATIEFGALAWREAYQSGYVTDVNALREDLWETNPQLNADSVLIDVTFELCGMTA